MEIGLIFILMFAFSFSIIQTKKIAEKMDPFVITVYSTLVGTSMLVGFLLLGTRVNLAQMIGSVILVIGVTMVTSNKMSIPSCH